MCVCAFFIDALEKLRKATQLLQACPSVRPRGIPRLPLEGFSRNLIFEYFSKIRRENSSFIKILQK